MTGYDAVNNTAAAAKRIIYFSNLDGVRALAALLVVCSHIELHKKVFGLQQLGVQQHINIANLGKVGVTIFFALSGFLITYLLLEEKSNYQKISLRDFYMRRILRIWPLYFLLVFIGFFVYPAQGSTDALWMSLCFLPNLAFSLNLLPALFDPIWSIGTEEQFYIFHPFIFRIKKNKHILYTLLLLTIVLTVITIVIRKIPDKGSFLAGVSQFLYYARFNNMLTGAIIAVLYSNSKHSFFKFRYQKLFNLLFNRYIQLLLIMAFFAVTGIYLRAEIPQGDVVLALLASLIILNLCEPATSIVALNNSKLQFCGKISYGIYLLHKYPLFLVLYLVKTYLSASSLLVQNITIYCMTILTVILLASVSYYGFERFFLRIKSRFQKIAQNRATG